MPFDPRQQMNPSAPGMTVWQRFAAMQQPQQQQGAPGQPTPQASPMGMNPSFISAIKEQMEKDNQPEAAPQAVNMGGEAPPTPDQQTSQSLAAGAQGANQVAQMGAQLKMARGGPVHMEEGGPVGSGGMTRGSLFGNQPGLTFKQAASLDPEEEEEPDKYGEYLKKQISDEGIDAPISSRDKWMALLQASLGTMAAASQPGATALGSVGQGGLTGLQGLREVQAQRAKEKMSKDALVGNLMQHEQSIDDKRIARAQQAYQFGLTQQQRQDELDQRIASDEKSDDANRQTRLDIADMSNTLGKQNADTAAEVAEQKKLAYDSRPLDRETSRYVNKALDESEAAGLNVEKYDDLINSIKSIKPTEGRVGQVEEWWKNQWGDQDLESRVKNDFGKIIKEAQLARLPRGPASDKDILFVQEFMLNPNSNNEEKIEFLSALSRLNADVAARKRFDADFSEKKFYAGNNTDFSVGDLTFKAGTTKGEAMELWTKANPYVIPERTNPPAASTEEAERQAKVLKAMSLYNN